MPCQGGWSDNRLNQEMRQERDELTQDLCYLCASLYAEGLLEKYGNPRIVKWHREHMHRDERRVQQEMEKAFMENLQLSASHIGDVFLQRALKEHPVSEYHQNWFFKIAEEIYQRVKSVKETQRTIEQQRKDALLKLTPEEIKLLNI